MLLTPEQIADNLQLNKETVLRWLRAGELQGIKAGKQWRIEHDKLKEFLERGNRNATKRVG